MVNLLRGRAFDIFLGGSGGWVIPEKKILQTDLNLARKYLGK